MVAVGEDMDYPPAKQAGLPGTDREREKTRFR
jgi:hypothetical protein